MTLSKVGTVCGALRRSSPQHACSHGLVACLIPGADSVAHCAARSCIWLAANSHHAQRCAVICLCYQPGIEELRARRARVETEVTQDEREKERLEKEIGLLQGRCSTHASPGFLLFAPRFFFILLCRFLVHDLAFSDAV